MRTYRQAAYRQAVFLFRLIAFVGNVTDGQTGRRQSGDRQTDKQATDRQATSVLATSDLKVKLGFDCLCEDRGTFGRRQASGRQAARYHSQWVRFFAQEAFFGFVAKFYARQEDRQAGRRQSGDRRTDRQATDRQATSVNFKVLCRR